MPDGAMTKICEGDVPTGWRETPLASVAEVRVSGVDKLARESEEPVRLCNYIDVYNNDYITGDLQFMQATATTPEIERFGLQVGDVIITKDSETPDDIGISAVVDYAAPDLVCGYHLALLRPKAQEVDSTFLAKQLKHHRLACYFGQRANGLTRYGLPNAVVANAPLWLPELPKQKAIGTILRSADEAIAKLKQVRAGLLHDLLTRGLDENGQLRDPIAHPEQFQDSPVGWIPISWSFGVLGDFINLLVGPAFESHRFSNGGDGIRLLRGLNVTKGHVRWDTEITERWSELTPDLEGYRLQIGDIVVGMDGALVGRNVAALTPGDVPSILVQRVARIRGLSRLASPYAYLLLTIPRFLRHIDTRKTHTAIPHITAGDIREYPVTIPEPDEQRHILKIVATADSELKAAEHELTKLWALKSGLMTDLLTGRVRVAFEIGNV